MTTQKNQSDQTADSPTTAVPAGPSNRAARRAQRKGKAVDGKQAGPRKDDQRRTSQVLAQPRVKGRRGNR